MAYLNHAFAICNLIAFLLVISPLPRHLKAWNAGTCIYIFWCGLGCLIHFVNGILYDNSTNVQSAIWCEMSARLLAGASFGIPAASIAINRRLYIISRNVGTGMPSQARMVLADLGIAFFLPGFFTCLISLPQGHRSTLFEDVGCFQPYYNTIPAFIIQGLPPVAFGLISCVYGALNVHTLYKRKIELKRLLAASSGRINIDFSEYYRLFLLGLLDAIFTIPLASWLAYVLITRSPLHPWIWAEVKLDYDVIWTFTRAEWKLIVGIDFPISIWFFVLCASIFFLFFGCNKEAREMYMHVIDWVFKPCCKLRSSKSLPPLEFQRDLPTSRRVTRQPHPLDMTFNSSVTTFATGNHQSSESERDVVPDFTFGSFSVENLGFYWNRSTTDLPPVPPLPAEFATSVGNHSDTSVPTTAVGSSDEIIKSKWRIRGLRRISIGGSGLAETLRKLLSRMRRSRRANGGIDEEKSYWPGAVE